MNFRSRGVQVRLMILVAITLGAVTLGEGIFSGRFSLVGLGTSAAVPLAPVETRLPAAGAATVESLTVLSLPESPKPWQVSTEKQNGQLSNQHDPVAADFWRRIYDSLSIKQRDRLQAALRVALRGETSPLGTSDRAELLRSLKATAESYQVQSAKELAQSTSLSPERQAEFKASLEQTMNQWREHFAPALTKTLNAEPLDDSDLGSLAAIDATLSELALYEVQDDEPSRSKDFVAWFGLFDRLKHDSKILEGAKEVSYANLFDQSPQYRGQPIQIRGVIRAAEYVAAPHNLYGVEGYYVFWLRPDNYQDAPIKVFSLAAPKSVATSKEDLTALIDRQCELQGLFFKRMVYRAQDDLRTVPTVLCAEMSLVAVDTSIKDANDSIGVVLISLVAAAIGVVMLVIYLFTDRRRIQRLPEKVQLPPQIASEK